MKISIGILAHNEAESIYRTLDSLFQQSLLRRSDREVEIICVPNGCSDNTADVSRSIFAQLEIQYPVSNLTWKVCELMQPGKPNAWNNYVHQFADTSADYMILMDADIWFTETHTLDLLVDELEKNNYVRVAVDYPVKDIVLKTNKNFIEHLSTFVSELSGSNNSVWICGQLYCGRTEILKRIYMPVEISVDDGFLYEMVTTDILTTISEADRVVCAPNASHVFEAYLNLGQLIKHERWLIIANIMNLLIFDHWKRVAPNESMSASDSFRKWDKQDPQWAMRLIQNERNAHSGWVSPPKFLNRRFMNLRHKSFLKAALLLPLAIVACGADFITLYTANQELSKVRSVD